MVANILDVAKIESGKLEITPEDVNVAQLAAECAGLAKAQADKAGVGLCVSLRIERARADPRALKQIFSNLFSNAVACTPAGGTVTLEARSENDDAVFCVRDTGCGMTEDQLARLGQPFQLLCSDAVLARNTAGAGLGLPLVRALAEAHDGAMSIESTTGQGTTVTVRLRAACPASLDAA